MRSLQWCFIIWNIWYNINGKYLYKKEELYYKRGYDLKEIKELSRYKNLDPIKISSILPYIFLKIDLIQILV